MMMQYQPLAAMLAAMGFACAAQAEHVVTIQGGRPTSLPSQIPTTMEGITGAQVEDRINAFDSEDALKYLPSLNVRKRFIGDYDHAVLASRASGTGNSARSLVYADGILLSNLLGNGAAYTPRWGLVTPEEIERVDVLYGPFSAAYAGNSVGAVVDFQTRMPSRLEAHAKLSWAGQDFRQYATNSRHTGRQASASLGNRSGALSWWVNLSRLDSDGQPIAFATRLQAAGVAPRPGEAAGVPVTGAIADRDPTGKPWYILGSTGQVGTRQDHAKVKLAYDLSPTLRASYTLGWWQNDVVRSSESYLHDASGNAVTSGTINIGGKRFALVPSDFAGARADLRQLMHGLSLKTHGRGFNWEIAGSAYDYSRDIARVPTGMWPGAAGGAGQGNLTDRGGSGWNTLSLRGNWRAGPSHQVELGVQRESAKLRTSVRSVADWVAGEGGRHVSVFNGNTRLESLFAQDTWRIAADWKAMLGLRHEAWRAYGGEISGASGKLLPFAGRHEQAWSPKAALSWRSGETWTLKASAGRALRNPTAAELFQGSVVDDRIINTDPSLRAEKSWTGELTAEHMTQEGSVRATLFGEVTRDALYAQPLTATVNTVQNVGKIRTRGLELSQQADDVFARGLTLHSSLTFADSEIVANDAMPSSVGKRQPRVPKWRANLLVSYHVGQHWSGTAGMRYSGRQFGTLDNGDPNGATYMGVSDFLVADVRLRYRFNRQWTASIGIDNLNGEKYWAFHPYAQRTVSADLKFDL